MGVASSVWKKICCSNSPDLFAIPDVGVVIDQELLRWIRMSGIWLVYCYHQRQLRTPSPQRRYKENPNSVIRGHWGRLLQLLLIRQQFSAQAERGQRTRKALLMIPKFAPVSTCTVDIATGPADIDTHADKIRDTAADWHFRICDNSASRLHLTNNFVWCPSLLPIQTRDVQSLYKTATRISITRPIQCNATEGSDNTSCQTQIANDAWLLDD